MVIIGADDSQPRFVKRIAAIDLGTNSFHAVIADLFTDGSFRRLEDLKEMVELAKGGLGTRLADDAFARGIDALKKIKVLCDSYEVEKILAFATSAIREAENGGEFIQASIDQVGIKIKAIPGTVEAELIGFAVQHGLLLKDDAEMVVDIGGGSVEFIILNQNTFHHLLSRKIGVSRMTDVFAPKDPIDEKDIAKLEAHYATELEELAPLIEKFGVKKMIGSSGTMQAIASMIAARKGFPVDITLNEFSFSKNDFMSFYQEFITLNESQRLSVKGLDAKRVRFINTGVVLVRWLFTTFGFEQIKISTQALREGIIIRYLKNEMIGLPSGEEFSDPRVRSVFELLRKCRWHEEHSRHVAKLALIIFDHLQDDIGLKDEDRELLQLAAYLHDIGYYISHKAHHKHALYLIRNADLKGFSEDEIEIMAHVARYHRRSTPKKRHTDYWNLAKPIKQRIKKLSGILRVADGLDRSHYQNVKQLEITENKDELTFEISTIDEPQLEIWGAMRKRKLLEEITGKTVSIIPKSKSTKKSPN